jgi:hypothetical protein
MGFSTYLHEWNHSMKYLKMKINQLNTTSYPCQLIKIQKQLSSFALLCMKIAHLLRLHSYFQKLSTMTDTNNAFIISFQNFGI